MHWRKNETVMQAELCVTQVTLHLQNMLGVPSVLQGWQVHTYETLFATFVFCNVGMSCHALGVSLTGSVGSFDCQNSRDTNMTLVIAFAWLWKIKGKFSRCVLCSEVQLKFQSSQFSLSLLSRVTRAENYYWRELLNSKSIEIKFLYRDRDLTMLNFYFHKLDRDK